MSSSRYAGEAHQRERTQLFANVSPYNPSQVMRPETPSSLGSGRNTPSYSDAVLNQLESQHDDQITGLTAKVRMLKDISQKIGDEVRDSTGLLSSLENGFETARGTVRTSMRRMVRSVREGGVGWRQWLTFFLIIWTCFFLVWLLF